MENIRLETVINLILFINLVFIVLLGISRLFFLRKGREVFNTIKKKYQPLVSIHLAICNEPHELVIDTIKSILNQNYKNFELIVLSNNTEEDKLWKPVADFCQLSKKIKFYNFKSVSGYKAGALNIALEKTNPNADFIFVVDSDYQLRKRALQIAVNNIQARDVDLLQFPQSYRNTNSKTKGLELSYNHYFDCYLSSENAIERCLPTGTLSIIKADIIKKVKWPTNSITEDANLGVELISNNYEIGFSNIIIGKGLMPNTVNDYNKQYKRWVFGNFQSLIFLLQKKSVGFIDKIKLATLLTAWINVLFITFVTGAILFPLGTYLQIDLSVSLILFCINILTHIIIQFSIFFKLSEYNFKKAVNGLAIHLSTIDVGSYYWFNYFIKKDKPFIRTNKFIVKDNFNLFDYIFPIVFLLSSITLYFLENKLYAFTLLIFSLIIIISKRKLVLELRQTLKN